MGTIIDIDFAVARAQASKLEEVANTLEGMINNDYDSTMQEIKAGWSGEASDRYMNKGSILESDMRTTVDRIRNVVNSIRTTVSKAEAAQKRAQELLLNKNF
ncbi:MAG: WXG100 family type VII secretion target [Lachnospiraceae bacterium]|nr:WXG100 family type VII secretion target [Lachnospiraceae bacterium]